MFKEKEDIEDLDDETLLDSDRDEAQVLEEMEKTYVYHIERGCPICRGEVRGNDFLRYFCRTCNLMFEKKDILEKDFGRHVDDKHRLTDEDRKVLMDRKKSLNEKIKVLFADSPAKEQKQKEIPVIMIPEPEIIPPKREFPISSHDLSKLAKLADITHEKSPTPSSDTEYETESEDKIIASKESTKIHMGNCHFIKRIHPENRIYFESIEEGLKDYQPCVCVRRVVAKRRSGQS